MIPNRFSPKGPIPRAQLCPEGHPVIKCSEPDNVYCPVCNTHYDPRPAYVEKDVSHAKG